MKIPHAASYSTHKTTSVPFRPVKGAAVKSGASALCRSAKNRSAQSGASARRSQSPEYDVSWSIPDTAAPANAPISSSKNLYKGILVLIGMVGSAALIIGLFSIGKALLLGLLVLFIIGMLVGIETMLGAIISCVFLALLTLYIGLLCNYPLPTLIISVVLGIVLAARKSRS